MKSEHQRIRNATRYALWACLCVLTASVVRLLACYVAVDQGPCGSVVGAACTNGCVAVVHTPRNSYCDSRDEDSGGTGCFQYQVPCGEIDYYYEKEYDTHGNCIGCGAFLGYEDMGSTSLANIAVVTGSCIVEN